MTASYKIDTSSLLVTKIHLPFAAQNAWANWNKGSLTTASFFSFQSQLYIAQRDFDGEGGNRIYRYIEGNSSSLSAPLITLPSGYEFYGSALAFTHTGALVVTAVQSGGGINYQNNKLLFYSQAGGGVLRNLSYTGYYFPAMLVPVFIYN